MFKMFVQTFPVSYTTTMKLTLATDGETEVLITRVIFSKLVND